MTNFFEKLILFSFGVSVAVLALSFYETFYR
jgi:hypothetical protein